MRALPLFFILLLTGCAGLPLPRFAPLDPQQLHAEVFATAYARVSEYYIEPKPLGVLVPNALANLHNTDKRYRIEQGADKQLLLTREGQVLASFSVPSGNDPYRWGEVTHALLRQVPLPAPVLYEATLTGLTAQLDPFSRYISPEESKVEAEWRTGYGGIGVTFERRGGAFAVVDVFIASPAARAGLKAGDSIIAIEGQATEAKSTEEFTKIVRGAIGTPIHLTTTRLGSVRIIREKVIPTTVAINMSGQVAIIRISRFMPGTVNEFKQAARQAVWQKAHAVVLDLQHNPGGYLDAAVEIGNLLLPRGPMLRIDGRHPDSHETFYAGGADVLVGLPLYVLQDGKSASAAEVLAAAIKDRGRGQLIGSTSYGKGSVQNVSPLPHGGELALTWAQMLSPLGKSFYEVGVAPDICLPKTVRPCPKTDNVESQALPTALGLIAKEAR
jgi:carboxyl-terminal processing protease